MGTKNKKQFPFLLKTIAFLWKIIYNIIIKFQKVFIQKNSKKYPKIKYNIDEKQ